MTREGSVELKVHGVFQRQQHTEIRSEGSSPWRGWWEPCIRARFGGGEAYKHRQGFAWCSEGFGVPLRVLSKRMRPQAWKRREEPPKRQRKRHKMLIKQIRKVTVGMKTGLRTT